MDIKKRYKEKGLGLTFAVLISYFYFFQLPSLIKEYLLPREIKNPELKFCLIAIIGHAILWLICNLSMTLVYSVKSEFFDRYRIHTHPWPWETNKEEWITIRNKTFGLTFINQCVASGLLYIKYFILGKKLEYRTDYESAPLPLEVIWQVSVFLILEDFLFYWSHRFLHWDKIYPYIHKVHHTHKVTVSIASEYAHPFEFIIGNILPVNFGPAVLGSNVHLITLCLWVVLRIIKTTEAHSGYEFSWSPIRLLPLQIPSDFHSYHHLKYKGNYGSFFRFWDELCGTVNSGYAKLKNESKLD
jgi:sterol desaturase/sphingolipid hydroxylase (fatty acid hydroxylase superfamily)